jgi:hypothetical protein
MEELTGHYSQKRKEDLEMCKYPEFVSLHSVYNLYRWAEQERHQRSLDS